MPRSGRAPPGRPSQLLLVALVVARLAAATNLPSLQDWLSVLSSRTAGEHGHRHAHGLERGAALVSAAAAAANSSSGASYTQGPYGAEAAAVAAVRCPANCTAHGNCDAENGVCDCPLGRAGAACEQATLGACELVAGHVTRCHGTLTSCACLQACAAALYGGNMQPYAPIQCLDAPPPRDATGAPAPPEALEAYLLGAQRPAFGTGSKPWGVAASSECGERGCNGRGFCRGAGRGCQCLFGWQGAACETAVMPPPGCLNDCSGAGECLAGWWCHCRPGFWGDDCALSMDAAGNTRLWAQLPHDWRSGDASAPLLPPPARPRVYVYHLPGRFNAWYAQDTPDRRASEMWHARLASSAHRVANGSDAELFFLPLPLRRLQRLAGGLAGTVAEDGVRLLAAQHPFFNATGGARHLLVTASDGGGGDLWRGKDWPPPLLVNMTMLTHHGGYGQMPALFRRGVDVLIPPQQSAATDVDFWHSPAVPPVPNNRTANAPLPRNITLFWAGTVVGHAGNASKTHNMRAAVVEAHGNLSGYLLRDTSRGGGLRQYGLLFATSRFCLAPAGQVGGWGRRATLAALYGCVPVLVQDDTADVLDELLDWSTFSLRIAEKDVDRLPALLAAVSPERLADMQRELACAWPRWIYSSVQGSLAGEDGGEDAISSTLQLLAARAVGIKPKAPCALREARASARCVGAPLRTMPFAPPEWAATVGGTVQIRGGTASWPPGGAACAGLRVDERPCAVPREAPAVCQDMTNAWARG